jgi:hypothetical protein
MPSTPAAINASFTGSVLNGLMIASIFFTAPKLELALQMASNPIQNDRSGIGYLNI